MDYKTFVMRVPGLDAQPHLLKGETVRYAFKKGVDYNGRDLAAIERESAAIAAKAAGYFVSVWNFGKYLILDAHKIPAQPKKERAFDDGYSAQGLVGDSRYQSQRSKRKAKSSKAEYDFEAGD